MASGAQEPATGLAKEFADYVRRQQHAHGWSLDDIATGIGMSKTYTTKRVSGLMQFTVKDFEQFANFIGTDPQELLARVRLPEAADYDGRLVPGYEVVSTARGKRVYLVEEATPTRRGDDNVTIGRFGADVRPDREDLGEVAGETDVDHSEDHDDYTP